MKARLPKVYLDEPRTAVLINTAGGLTGGDRVSVDATWGDGVAACLTTQAAERVYRSTGGDAVVTNRLVAGEDARAEWLPQETILFDEGRFHRRTSVHLAAGARFLAVESMVLGRKAMGETVMGGLIDDEWQLRRDGRLVWRDSLRLDDTHFGPPPRPAVLGANRAYATIVCQTADPDACAGLIREHAGAHGGASAMRGLVLARLAAEDGDSLRRIMTGLIPALRHIVFGRSARLPRPFQI
ncbi:MAG: urease accessory protein UreD [Minwuia sp.]|uniref:urease accessory protein UreD n=1 Tax=Minwuia sp. TaxID=2493630 RepID=UPI003A8A5486